MNSNGMSFKTKIVLIIFATALVIIGIIVSSALMNEHKENRKEIAENNASQILEELQPAEDLNFTIDSNTFSNAFDKFLSEYEMFKNDLSCGFFNVDNMSVTQSKIYNLTGITDSQGISEFENDKFDKQTGYPIDTKLVKDIVSLYSKNGSLNNAKEGYSYWYTPSNGTIVYASEFATAEELNGIVFGSSLVQNEIVWLNLSK